MALKISEPEIYTTETSSLSKGIQNLMQISEIFIAKRSSDFQGTKFSNKNGRITGW